MFFVPVFGKRKDGVFCIVYQKSENSLEKVYEKTALNADDFKCLLKEAFSLLKEKGGEEVAVSPIIFVGLDSFRKWIKSNLSSCHPFALAFFKALMKKAGSVKISENASEEKFFKVLSSSEQKASVKLSRISEYLNTYLPCPKGEQKEKKEKEDEEEENPFDIEEKGLTPEMSADEESEYRKAVEVLMGKIEKREKGVEEENKNKESGEEKERKKKEDKESKEEKKKEEEKKAVAFVFYEFYASFLYFLAKYKEIEFSKLIKLEYPDVEKLVVRACEKTGITPYAYFGFASITAVFSHYLDVSLGVKKPVVGPEFYITPFSPVSFYAATVPLPLEEKKKIFGKEERGVNCSLWQDRYFVLPSQFLITEEEYKKGERPQREKKKMNQRTTLLLKELFSLLKERENQLYFSDKNLTDYFLLLLLYSYLASSTYPFPAETDLMTPVEALEKLAGIFSKLTKLEAISSSIEEFWEKRMTCFRRIKSIASARVECARKSFSFLFVKPNEEEERNKKVSGKVYSAVKELYVGEKDFEDFKIEMRKNRNALTSYLNVVKNKIANGNKYDKGVADELEEVVRYYVRDFLDGELHSYDFVIG